MKKPFSKFSVIFVIIFLNLITLLPTDLVAEKNTRARLDNDANIDREKLSRAFGYYIGINLASPYFSFNPEEVIIGLREGVEGKTTPPMSFEEYEAKLAYLQEKAHAMISEDNLEQAEEYLKKNRLKEDVVILEEGKLQYQILKKGSGHKVQKTSTPLISYKATYCNGEPIDIYNDSEEPISISLNELIPGFAKGIDGMKEGEIRKIYIHPDLGYGSSDILPPNVLLIFDVEVIKANVSDKEIDNA